MNTLDIVYQNLLEAILNHGVDKKDRTGTGTKSVFGYQIRHNMQDGFPLLTTKKMYFKGIVTELLWFLRGDTNIKYLVDNDCHIWDGDCYKNYINKEHLSMSFNFLTEEEFINKIKTDDEFAKKWGELGPIYGKQWRNWGMFAPFHTVKGVDQIANLISELKTNPDSRRLMVSAWNVGELDQMVLPPCHYGFQVYTRELSEDERYELCAAKKSKITAISEDDYIKYNIPTRAISLMWNQRSVDVPLGLPFNIASYGLLLEIIAKEVNMVPDELIGNLGDCHIYTNQIDGVKEQIGTELTLKQRMEIYIETHPDWVIIPEDSFFDGHNIPRRTREPFELPKLKIQSTLFEFGKPDTNKLNLDYYSHENFILENYQSHPAIKMPLSN